MRAIRRKRKFAPGHDNAEGLLTLIRMRARECCCVFNADGAEATYHSKDWGRAYPQAGPYPPGASVFVEAGITLHADHATTHYRINYPHCRTSDEYGESLPYPDSVAGFPYWYDKLVKQLDGAAQTAFEHGLLTCIECDHHYVGSDVCCKPDDD